MCVNWRCSSNTAVPRARSLMGSGTIRPVTLMPVVSRFGHWAIQVRAQRYMCCAIGILPRNYD